MRRGAQRDASVQGWSKGVCRQPHVPIMRTKDEKSEMQAVAAHAADKL